MPKIVLHHYPRSPFAEKVRLALGLKGLSHGSVTVPRWMPKPDLVPLTGGYRRTPAMQVGADIYCDTLLILQQIEHMQPSPSLYPHGTEGVATALGWLELMMRNGRDFLLGSSPSAADLAAYSGSGRPCVSGRNHGTTRPTT